MTITDSGVYARLATFADSSCGEEFATAEAIRGVRIVGGDVAVDIEPVSPRKRQGVMLKKPVADAPTALPAATRRDNRRVAHYCGLANVQCAGIATCARHGRLVP